MDKTTITKLKDLLRLKINRYLDPTAQSWLQEKAALFQSDLKPEQLSVVFSSVQRNIPKQSILLTSTEQKNLNNILPGFTIDGWTLQRTCRVFLIMNLDASDKESYVNKIEYVFKNAEMNELIAMYSALPVLAYPEDWKMRCSEGIRNNIALVLEAIMHNNPYPAKYLSEQAWNQMVLKAFFTEKNIDKIVGLDKRKNPQLASTLADYAQERTSAGRSVNEKLWPLVHEFKEVK